MTDEAPLEQSGGVLFWATNGRFREKLSLTRMPGTGWKADVCLAGHQTCGRYLSVMRNEAKSSGAIALAFSGIASSFALAACCALPILLAGAGLSAYWLEPFATFGLQFTAALTVLALLSLAGAAFIVLRSAKTCAPGDLCARPWFRAVIALAAVCGTILLIASKLYA
jgi:mercuric ion transport protein